MKVDYFLYILFSIPCAPLATRATAPLSLFRVQSQAQLLLSCLPYGMVIYSCFSIHKPRAWADFDSDLLPMPTGAELFLA